GDTSAHDIDRRDRQQHLFADHPAQAGGGTADAHVRYFRKRILFDLGELACVDLHCAAFLRRRTAPDKNAPRASSVRGLATKAALSSLARPIISSWRLAETTATGIVGLALRIFATSARPSVPGMLKSIKAMSTERAEIALTASSALVASIISQSGRIRRSALAITMRASLLSSTTSTLYCILHSRRIASYVTHTRRR